VSPMRHKEPATWQLPAGVTRGLWQYVTHPHIADDYDDYFAFNRLFEFDEQIVRRFLGRPSRSGAVVVDLGCGTGRALIPLVRSGFRGLAVDLSEHMLHVVQDKADIESLDIQCLHASIVELDGIADQSIDHAISLFSTLGMIRGRGNRLQALKHVRRVLRPGGRCVLHVHNFWYNLYDPGGPWWLLQNLVGGAFRRDLEIGDKYFPYRGVPRMFLHVFRPGELRRDLRRVGFRLVDMIPLDPQRHRQLKWRRVASSLRANGWIVVAEI
jgi:SAM-dependent methyltransferase